MTKDEAKIYLEGISPQPVNMVTLDATVWEEFKSLMLAILNDPTLNPKYRTAVEEINTIADSALE